MTTKELDKKLEKIKRQLNRVEKDIQKEKKREVIIGTKKNVLKKFLENLEPLRDEISQKWDGKLNAVEEIRAQRNKD